MIGLGARIVNAAADSCEHQDHAHILGVRRGGVAARLLVCAVVAAAEDDQVGDSVLLGKSQVRGEFPLDSAVLGRVVGAVGDGGVTAHGSSAVGAVRNWEKLYTVARHLTS